MPYFANWEVLGEVPDSLSGRRQSVLAVGLVLVTANLGEHHVWSNA